MFYRKSSDNQSGSCDLSQVLCSCQKHRRQIFLSPPPVTEAKNNTATHNSAHFHWGSCDTRAHARAHACTTLASEQMWRSTLSPISWLPELLGMEPGTKGRKACQSSTWQRRWLKQAGFRQLLRRRHRSTAKWPFSPTSPLCTLLCVSATRLCGSLSHLSKTMTRMGIFKKKKKKTGVERKKSAPALGS